MTPRGAPRSWFATIVGSAIILGIVSAYVAFPGRVTEMVVIVISVLGGIMIQGEKIVEAVKARFSKGDA